MKLTSARQVWFSKEVATRANSVCDDAISGGREFAPVTDDAALLAGSGGESPHRRFCNFFAIKAAVSLLSFPL